MVKNRKKPKMHFLPLSPSVLLDFEKYKSLNEKKFNNILKSYWNQEVDIENFK